MYNKPYQSAAVLILTEARLVTRTRLSLYYFDESKSSNARAAVDSSLLLKRRLLQFIVQI